MRVRSRPTGHAHTTAPCPHGGAIKTGADLSQIIQELFLEVLSLHLWWWSRVRARGATPVFFDILTVQQPGSAWHVTTTQSRAAGQSAHRALEPCVVHVQSRERHAALSGLCPRRITHSDAMPFLLGICFLPIDALLHYHRIPVSPGRAPRACQRTKAQRLLAQAGPEPAVPTRLLAQRPPPMHHWQPMFPPSLRAARG